MILVLASRRDAGAHRLVNTWGPEQARLLTPDDLSSPGWRVFTEDPAASRAVVHGEVVEVGELTGVVTRLPAVTSGEVRRIQPDDRDYAAAEMSAFLNYWLSVLSCPVLNPPAAAGLCGPGWRSEQWAMTARRLGMPVRPRGRDVPPYLRPAASSDAGAPAAPAGQPAMQVTVIGDRCIGGDERALTEFAEALTEAAGVPMLTAFFEEHGSEVRFVDAHPWTNAFDPQVADAMLDYFHRSGTAAVPGAHRESVTP
ncbi:hypothetical protein ACFS5L_15950 [Streptomyces phyllanthi]|uniref:Uncharacterized protein n=1 Tax=Streptomyces phyllanthi TaxID=1803180 RepID=A0A5N8VW26_9ACTN|nr:hypothetical protein [Streptomyces phyllanthi]MPY38896.1 hypothetical protein [Streptomyces phyllanthi]